MMSAEQTSAEKLEQMLTSGKISRDDYDCLRGAMQKKGPAPAEQVGAGLAGEVRTLKKSWAKRQFGGVCGGFGDYFRIDPLIVRIVAVVALLAAGPLTIAAYIALYFVLPWDEPAAAHEPERKGRPYSFGAAIFLLLWAAPVLIGQFVAPPLLAIYSDMGMALPSLSQMAFGVLDNSMNHVAGYFILMAIATGLMTAIYLISHKPTLRRVFAAVCLAASLLWPLLLLAGIYAPLFGMSGTTP